MLLWLVIDPLAIPFVLFLPMFASYETADVWGIGIFAVIGTLQWYLVGRGMRWLSQ